MKLIKLYSKYISVLYSIHLLSTHILKWNFLSSRALPARGASFEPFSSLLSFFKVQLEMLLKFFRFISKFWVLSSYFIQFLFSINSSSFYKLMLYFFIQFSPFIFYFSLLFSHFFIDFFWTIIYSGFYFFLAIVLFKEVWAF